MLYKSFIKWVIQTILGEKLDEETKKEQNPSSFWSKGIAELRHFLGFKKEKESRE